MTASRCFLYEEINGPQYSGEASLSKPSHSANPREECRFILLGGDDFTKNEACKILLRNGQSQQRADLEGWEVKENRVQGRHVTVAISPSRWLKHLKSFFFSRRVKSIKNEIQKCASVVFPGPNAFLLVIRDGHEPGKVHLLLKAVASVFGKEAFDYSMVLFIRGDGEKRSDPASMKCVKNCGKRHHFLEDTDSSVQNLFMRVGDMTANTNSKFFIPPAYAEPMNKFEPWEKKRILYIKTLLDECKDEKRQKDQHIKELKMKMETSQQRESELEKKLHDSNMRESKLKKKLHDSSIRESELEKKLHDSSIRESELEKKLGDSRLRERELEKKLGDSRLRERELEKKLGDSWLRERELGKKLDESRLRESELEKDLEATQLRGTT
ncbi:GTPase IMAP family member 7-like isoform X1 [Ictalurus furcatus]|uniref:GTPase IMAP family member 7-like isoform X1 n=2 Tax=Ictalurus furcatus TaxID=66913 RepID=UPI00234FCFE7|nr:GTPase IMAP family member 7-like isoform X1 [Ictalurus furcatus]